MIEVSVSLEDLIRSELGETKRIGRRLFWLCPFHEDRIPSLTITPDGRHWKCFGCDKSGDAIQWVRERRGLSFPEAVSFLKGEGSGFSFAGFRPPSPPPTPEKASPPSAEWTRNATAVVAECAARLTGPAGDKARQWLHARGLTGDTIHRWQLGYNPRHRSVRGLYLRHGITIPWSDERSVRGIKIRQPISSPKYLWVGGSQRSGLFLGRETRPGFSTLVVEGEFDALLGWQEIRHLVNVVTLGSASETPDQLSLEQLLTSPLILVCYDDDPAGRAGARRWSSRTNRARMVRLPHGKDLTEFYRAGGDLRRWIDHVLQENSTHPTRHLTGVVNPMNDNEVNVGSPTRHLPDTSDGQPAAPGCHDFKEEVTC